MPVRVLVALSIDAVGAARIPEVLAAAGLEVTLVCPANRAALSSRYVTRHIPAGPDIAAVHTGLEEHVAAYPDR